MAVSVTGILKVWIITSEVSRMQVKASELMILPVLIKADLSVTLFLVLPAPNDVIFFPLCYLKISFLKFALIVQVTSRTPNLFSRLTLRTYFKIKRKIISTFYKSIFLLVP